jgi:hypothetical protein
LILQGEGLGGAVVAGNPGLDRVGREAQRRQGLAQLVVDGDPGEWEGAALVALDGDDDASGLARGGVGAQPDRQVCRLTRPQGGWRRQRQLDAGGKLARGLVGGLEEEPDVGGGGSGCRCERDANALVEISRHTQIDQGGARDDAAEVDVVADRRRAGGAPGHLGEGIVLLDHLQVRDRQEVECEKGGRRQRRLVSRWVDGGDRGVMIGLDGARIKRGRLARVDQDRLQAIDRVDGQVGAVDAVRQRRLIDRRRPGDLDAGAGQVQRDVRGGVRRGRVCIDLDGGGALGALRASCPFAWRTEAIA